jgi:DNA-binding CsgD family transcriptional regulator
VRLALALALLGRREPAVDAARRAVALRPRSRDAYEAPYYLYQLARVLTMTGDRAGAAAQLAELLRVPSLLTPGWLAIDPTFRRAARRAGVRRAARRGARCRGRRDARRRPSGPVAVSAPPAGPEDEHEVTALLRAASAGDDVAFDRAFSRVYDELHHLARRVRGGRASDTLGRDGARARGLPEAPPVGGHGVGGTPPLPARRRARHAPGARRRGARAARREARRRRVQRDARRGGARRARCAPRSCSPSTRRWSSWPLLDERQARVVELRWFAGLTAEETADVLGVSEPTVRRDWRAARAWLGVRLRGG